MDRVALVRAKLDGVKSFAADAFKAGPPCSHCRHKTLLGDCGNIANASQSFDPTKGRYSEAYNVPVAEARADGGLCGPEGLLWEDMPPHKAAWREVSAFADRHPWLSVGSVVGLWAIIDAIL